MRLSFPRQHRSTDRLAKLSVWGIAAAFAAILALIVLLSTIAIAAHSHRKLDRAGAELAAALAMRVDELDRELMALSTSIDAGCNARTIEALIQASLGSRVSHLFLYSNSERSETCGPIATRDYAPLLSAPAAIADSLDSTHGWLPLNSIHWSALRLIRLAGDAQVLASVNLDALWRPSESGRLGGERISIQWSARTPAGASARTPAHAPIGSWWPSRTIAHPVADKGLTVRAVVDAELIAEQLLPSAPFVVLAAVLITWLMTSTINHRLLRRAGVEWRLLDALRKRRFEPVVQPIVDAQTGACRGAEVLMRWQHPVRGLLAPAEFIDFAERSGLIVPMSKMLMIKARDRLSRIAERRPNLYFSFNFTNTQLKQPGLIDELGSIFKDDGLPLSRVVIEIIERDLIDQHAHQVLRQLRQLGCRVAVDDFGTGQSSLAMLETIEVDFLKIDREFVSTIDAATVTRPVLDAIIRLAGQIGVRMIAEGVETHSQRDYLRNHDVHSLQGYLIARPMPIRDFERWLDEHEVDDARQAESAPIHA